jgi:alpha-tubulin suppressor-like RCC1 family protein
MDEISPLFRGAFPACPSMGAETIFRYALLPQSLSGVYAMHRIIVTLFAVFPVLSFLLTCGDQPNNPFSPESAKVFLILKSSNYTESDTAVTDTLGKTVRLGLCLYLTEHIDSTVISVSSSAKIDTTIVCRRKDKPVDTAFYDLVFLTPGTRTVMAIAYVGKDLRQATAKIYVVARPVPNRKPELTVTGARIVTAGQNCSLTVSTTDPDSGQKVTVDTLKSPSGSSFSDSVFTWQTTIADTGFDTVIFIARDNSNPPLTDTEVVSITVNPIKVNHPPTWDMDTVDLTGTVGFPVSLTLTDKCSDPDNDTISFALLAGAPDGDTVQNGAYSFTPHPVHEGTFYPHVIVRDPRQLSDTLVIKLTISPADTTPPTLLRLSPDKDSTTISASSCQVRVSATDKSGILSVRCFKAADSIPVTRSDTVYTATVTGIIQNQYAKVTFLATDSSRNANRCTLSVFIKRDSTMLDAEGPVIIQKSGPVSGTVITDSIFTITDSILDPSGIDSVYWILNSVRAGTMSPVSGSSNNYTLRDTLSKYRINRIVIHAIDRSTRRNHDSAVVELDYNLPPKINDTAVAVDRNTAKTWTLSAQSQDNDSLFWSRISSPSSLSGIVTGVLPSVTFTPINNWSGTDSFYIRVADGYWSDTAKIKINVVDMPVAPSIVTQPQNLTITLGQAASFSVAINTDVNPAPTYLWKRNGTTIISANAASFSIGAVAIEDSGSYTVTVSNGAGTVTSQPALLTVQYAPVITTHPHPQTLYLNQPVTFTVAARGNPAPTYQWKKNGSVISGQIGATYTISSPGVADSGRYTASAMNSVDTVESDTAGLYAVVKSISAGENYSLILETDGRLLSCGNNSNGQLGNGSEKHDSIPRQIMTDVQSIAAGGSHSLILKIDGILYACGYNAYGQLGDGTTNNQRSPVQIMTGVQAIAAGGYHSLILKSNEILYGCGYNIFGQLGNGTTSDQHTPVQIMTGVQAIAAGGTHSLILKSNGTLFACGANSFGQLGNDTTSNQFSPVQIMTDVKVIAAGDVHSLILKTNGALFACGFNGNGQLGNGNTQDQHSPVQTITDIRAIAAGAAHSLFLKTNGILYACGHNYFGQLGDGTTTERHLPVQIMTDVQSIATGGSHTLILKAEGTLYSCGYNNNGQLGDGTSNNRVLPVRVSF